MNVKNNKRRRESQEKIERAFIELLQTREIKDITVSDIIKMTELNRSTFYANYIDIFDDRRWVKDKHQYRLRSTCTADYNDDNRSSRMHVYSSQRHKHRLTELTFKCFKRIKRRGYANVG